MDIRKEDCIERFIRSSRPGGQNVNKTSTCVYLKHIPTGIEVKCQKERTQAQNRMLAWRLLLEKIERRKSQEQAQKKAHLERQRRKNRKRPPGLKLKILEEKRLRARKKLLRRKVRQREYIDL